MGLTLTREIRFALEDPSAPEAPGSSNGFAANPALAGIGTFLALAATLSGEVDPSTGMLINIKLVDRILRESAVPRLRHLYFRQRASAENALLELWGHLHDCFAPHALCRLHLAASPYLSFTCHDKEPGMVQLCLRFEFSAAHRLHSAALSASENADVFGRCNNPNGHGHNYELEVVVSGEPQSTGHVMPVRMLQEAVNRHIIEPFDHKHLNLDCAEFGELNPTVENIAGVLFRKLAPHIPGPARLACLRVWETPKTMCEYSE
jgi:6-pyruvoyltetrahydropterin/6-carboxytetrahydropterin synthase